MDISRLYSPSLAMRGLSTPATFCIHSNWAWAGAAAITPPISMAAARVVRMGRYRFFIFRSAMFLIKKAAIVLRQAAHAEGAQPDGIHQALSGRRLVGRRQRRQQLCLRHGQGAQHHRTRLARAIGATPRQLTPVVVLWC